MHAISRVSPALASEVSDLLYDSVTRRCVSTYGTAFRSLQHFCSLYPGLPCLPTDAGTVCAWLRWMCPRRISPPSCVKYLAGLRWAHLCHGLDWSLSSHPLVKQVLSALNKRYPQLCTSVLKAPITYELLVKLASSMGGWPCLNRLSYDDLLWLTASSVAFFASLRGGEFFTYPGSDRPLLLGSMVSVQSFSSVSQFVSIKIPLPKTAQGHAFQSAFAVCPTVSCPLSPVSLLQAYRSRCRSLGVNVLNSHPCFCLRSGLPLDRSFMVLKAGALMASCNVKFTDEYGRTVPVKAASWRAGYVTSALEASVPELAIRSNGRWSSQAGVLPYSVSSLEALQRSSTLITSPRLASRLPISVIGRLNCESVFEVFDAPAPTR